MHAFALTWDYRCPFARIVHETVLDALDAGAPWEVEFVPFSLAQAHVEEGEAPMWERPDDDSGLLALQAGVVARDRFPEHFPAVHRGLFDARHVDGRAIRDREVVADVVRAAGIDDGAVFAEIDAGWPLETVHKEHEHVHESAGVWGVPTFVADGRGVFVRLMEGSHGDGALAQTRIDRILDLFDSYPELNEYKFTQLPR